jgi:glutathione reductase (NADPH)
MSRTDTFDLVVVGTGVAATTAAWKCHAAGWSVAIVDSRPFGGTCALRGCDPKKVLVGAAEIIDWNRRLKNKGISYSNAPEIAWQDLIKFKRSFTEPVPKQREEQFSKAGITAIHGIAKFVSDRTLEVGKHHLLAGSHILIATGAEPAKLNIPGEENIIKSDEFMELNELPPKIVFVGGGYISFEFAHVAARAGAKVTILHRGTRPLNNFDPYLIDMLLKKTRDVGIEVILRTRVDSIESRKDDSNSGGTDYKVHYSGTENNKVSTVDANIIVHGAGRAPALDHLNLESAGIQGDGKGVKVNEYLQSISNPSVYAAGDAAATGGLPLTPIGVYEGEIAAENMLNGNHATPNYKGTPSVVYTIPPLASVGLQENEATMQGLKFKTNKASTIDWYSSKRVGENHTGYKVIIEQNTDRILGAHLFAPNSEEVINIFALAIRFGLKAAELKQAIYSYPTNSSDVGYML